MGKVTFGKAQATVLYDKIHQGILSKFPSTSTKKYANRKMDNQLAIMRYVVITMFLRYKGNGIVPKKRSRPSKPKSTIRQTLTGPLVVSPITAAVHTRSPQESAGSSLARPQLFRRIVVTPPTLLDKVSITPPIVPVRPSSVHPNVTNNPLLLPLYASYYSDVADRFESPNS
jgi:hypothetical protein